MRFTHLACVIAVVVCSMFSAAQTRKDKDEVVTITEPSVIPIEKLYKHADVVALVKIVSGDTENYTVPIYKAEVLVGFKGAAKGQKIYFGPHIGNRLGWEYVVFLANENRSLQPKSGSTFNYGNVRPLEVFNQGYSSMMTSYECVFDGDDPARRCDYGVRVCTDYIVLPKSTPAFPTNENPPFGCRWVRKGVFLYLLEHLATANAPTPTREKPIP